MKVVHKLFPLSYQRFSCVAAIICGKNTFSWSRRTVKNGSYFHISLFFYSWVNTRYEEWPNISRRLDGALEWKGGSICCIQFFKTFQTVINHCDTVAISSAWKLLDNLKMSHSLFCTSTFFCSNLFLMLMCTVLP